MNDNSIDNRLLNILRMDFDDMAKEDTNYFRNRIREEFRVSADYITLDRAVCRTAFCLLKRKYIHRIETVFIQPKPLIKDGGSFGVRSRIRKPITLPVWDHLRREKVGVFAVESGMYPLIDVWFTDRSTCLTILVDNGFIDMDDTLFDFHVL